MQPVPQSEYLESSPRTWPTVLGILGCLWGFIGAITSALAVAGVGQEAQPPVLRGALGTASSVTGLVLAILALVAGVQLLRRRPAGVQLLRAWAPLSALAQGFVVVLMFMHQPEFERTYREQMEREHQARAEKSGQAASPLPPGVEKAMFGIGAGCGGLIAVVPPLVVAIFVFGRRGREAVAEWSQGAAS
jgi:hypothetical protein